MSNWVFLRGLMREQRHWDAFPGVFRAAVPDAHIVTPDLPGNGQRHAMASAQRVADMVEFCRRDLAERGCAAPYHLLALSLGGMLAVEWAARYPQEIAALVLINTSMRPFSPFYRRLRWQNYAALVALAALGGLARQEALILRLTSSADDGRAPLLPRWIAYQREYPVTRANALRQLLSAARYRAPARRPAAPVLVLASRADRLVDASCSLRLAAHWRAACALHPDAGHDLPLDDGAWVAAQVAQWLHPGNM
ncbi:alpha/beta fold hydrolase [Janthinobacterium fluminis]|uniref:Alpha/beta hydrolase n=1 Tax=Janthinobacterium fluminis TaxID=2987524 RepID=A0ABT5JW76_9BURK|nr:alpha/beta hydrolase [Janthinobacterium fluminis]MDC8756982.1 alpha/beta hydrolase [Janthinobacterium fluminis]